MAAYAGALTTLNVEYYETMAATEKVRGAVVKAQDGFVRGLGSLILWFPFWAVTRETEKLVSGLTMLETLPSSILLDKEAEKIPESLRELFQKMCEVLQKSEAEGLHKSSVLGGYVARLNELSRIIIGFADRFADAQIKLRSRVLPEQMEHYKESFEAYRNCELMPEQPTDEDVKRPVLHI